MTIFHFIHQGKREMETSICRYLNLSILCLLLSLHSYRFFQIICFIINSFYIPDENIINQKNEPENEKNSLMVLYHSSTAFVVWCFMIITFNFTKESYFLKFLKFIQITAVWKYFIVVLITNKFISTTNLKKIRWIGDSNETSNLELLYLSL